MKNHQPSLEFPHCIELCSPKISLLSHNLKSKIEKKDSNVHVFIIVKERLSYLEKQSK